MSANDALGKPKTPSGPEKSPAETSPEPSAALPTLEPIKQRIELELRSLLQHPRREQDIGKLVERVNDVVLNVVQQEKKTAATAKKPAAGTPKKGHR